MMKKGGQISYMTLIGVHSISISLYPKYIMSCIYNYCVRECACVYAHSYNECVHMCGCALTECILGLVMYMI